MYGGSPSPTSLNNTVEPAGAAAAGIAPPRAVTPGAPRGRAPADHSSPASPVPTAAYLAALARAATASTSSSTPTGGGHVAEGLGSGFLCDDDDGAGAAVAAAVPGGVYCSSPEESDFGDDERGEEGFDGGGGSQKGFWYGEGGGASALEAAMGQWGGDFESSAADAAAAGAAGAAGASGGRDSDDDDDTGSDTTCSDVGVELQEASAHGVLRPVVGAVAATADPAATGGAGRGEGVDESWEIVNPPAQWEADAVAAAVSGNKTRGLVFCLCFACLLVPVVV